MSGADWRIEAAWEARRALGNVSAKVAWFFVTDKVAEALERYPNESQHIAEELNLFNQPDDPLELHDFEDLLEVVVGMNPDRAIKYFHYMNPEFNLQMAREVAPLQTLRAVMMMFQSDLWASEH